MSDVTEEIYPPEDYEGETLEGNPGPYDPDQSHIGPPRLWVGALPVRNIAADDTILYTIALQSPGNVTGVLVTPTLLVPQVPNNTRRRALIVCTINAIAITDSPDPREIRTFTGTTVIPNGFHLPVQTLYEYTSADALYACARGAAASFSFVSVAIDMYETIRA